MALRHIRRRGKGRVLGLAGLLAALTLFGLMGCGPASDAEDGSGSTSEATSPLTSSVTTTNTTSAMDPSSGTSMTEPGTDSTEPASTLSTPPASMEHASTEPSTSPASTEASTAETTDDASEETTSDAPLTDTSETEATKIPVADPTDEERAESYAKEADAAQTALWEHYWNPTGRHLYREYPPSPTDEAHDYWWFAHGIDTMIDGFERTGEAEYLDRATKIAMGVYNRRGNFVNDFYDDMDWMSLALLRIFDHTDDYFYLEQAQDLFEVIMSAWSEEGGGGLGWQRNRPFFKNTPTNAPAVILAVRLFERTGDAMYQEWAHKIFDWLHDTLRNPETGYVYDGINDDQAGGITYNAYTYNHGTYVGAATEMYRMTGDRDYLEAADLTFRHAMSHYSDGLGIIMEQGGGDGGLFKGILMRYLTQYYFASPERPEDLKEWVATNADAAVQFATNDLGLIGDYWGGPPKEELELSPHLSGVMVLEAAWKLHTPAWEGYDYGPESFGAKKLDTRTETP